MSHCALWALLATLLTLATPALAADQPPSDEMSRFLAEQQQAKSGFDQQYGAAFSRYKDARDKEFLSVLESQWSAFEESAGLVRDPAPKPTVLPKAKVRPLEVDPAPEIKPVQPIVLVPPTPKPAPDTVTAPIPTPQPLQPTGPLARFNYFGLDLKLSYDKASRVQLGGSIDKQTIGRFWEAQSGADYSPLVARLQGLKNELHLNDWAFVQLIQATCEAIQPGNNEATLHAWFLLTKCGYRTRIGYNDDRVYLLAAARSTIYQVPYYTLEGTRYYNISFLKDGKKPGTVYTYESDYPGAEHSLSLALDTIPRTGETLAVKNLHFTYDGKSHTVPVTYNKNSVAFCNAYPQTDFPVFFEARVPALAEQSLLAALGPLVSGRSEVEAVNLLLRFVQTAFDYQTDDDQFGREKYMFVEETLSYPHSDCEDRAILFSFLVRRLTGLEVVGLHYPGHLATAVLFNNAVRGDAVSVAGRTFVVCDPTYINANVGMAMPQFKSVTPEVIRAQMLTVARKTEK